jgi:nucleoside 2-deoxyribosyltransferase
MYEELEGQDLGTAYKCRVCKSFALHHASDPMSLAEMVTCPTCGKYRMGGRGDLWLNGIGEEQRKSLYRVSFALRSISERARGKRDNSFFPVYDDEDFEKMIAVPDPSVQEKLDMLLTWLGTRSVSPGRSASLDQVNDYAVVAAHDREEISFLASALHIRGLITNGELSFGSSGVPYKVTAEGWAAISELNQSASDSTVAFVAMWFDPLREPIEKAISRAVSNSGYKPIRIDQVEHVNRIDDEIIASIRRSKFLVADFTGQRNGVYFESGFMLGLGRIVIWICDKQDLHKVHFDTRQYNTIVYENGDDLEKRLQLRIEALMGKGPISPA